MPGAGDGAVPGEDPLHRLVVAVVAHTHPTAINMLTTSARWREHLDGRLFPDEVVVLGEHSAFVPYIDPGVELARAILASVNEVAARDLRSPTPSVKRGQVAPILDTYPYVKVWVAGCSTGPPRGPSARRVSNRRQGVKV